MFVEERTTPSMSRHPHNNGFAFVIPDERVFPITNVVTVGTGAHHEGPQVKRIEVKPKRIHPAITFVNYDQRGWSVLYLAIDERRFVVRPGNPLRVGVEVRI